MNISDKLIKISERKKKLEALLEKGHELSSDEFVKYSKELAEVTPVATAIDCYQQNKKELSDLDLLLKDPESDAEMKEMAKEEKETLEKQLIEKEKEIQLLLLPKDAADEKCYY